MAARVSFNVAMETAVGESGDEEVEEGLFAKGNQDEEEEGEEEEEEDDEEEEGV